MFACGSAALQFKARFYKIWPDGSKTELSINPFPSGQIDLNIFFPTNHQQITTFFYAIWTANKGANTYEW